MKIYDDVLDKQFLDYINHSLLSMKWRFHVSTNNSETIENIERKEETIENIERKEEYIFLFRIIISIIEKEPEFKGKKIFLESGYVNLYPFGIGGDWHTDSESLNERTILFYPSDWKEEYEGATEFQESGEKVEYKKNRLLMFDGIIPHRSAVHQNPKNRYTIAFKAYLVDPEEEQSNENQ